MGLVYVSLWGVEGFQGATELGNRRWRHQKLPRLRTKYAIRAFIRAPCGRASTFVLCLLLLFTWVTIYFGLSVNGIQFIDKGYLAKEVSILAPRVTLLNPSVAPFYFQLLYILLNE